MADLHDLLGRRFEFTDKATPDITLVGVDPAAKMVRLHATDGTRQSVPTAVFLRAYRKGTIAESMLPGFVIDTPVQATAMRIRAQRRDGILRQRDKHRDAVGVAGTGKRIRTFEELGVRK